MMFIEFTFAFVSLVLMCCAFHERMTRDQSVASEEIRTSEEEFHTLIERINMEINLGIFGIARQTCITALETLASARLNRKTVTDQLEVDLKKLSVYIHELDYETEALPVYKKVKATLKTALTDRHNLTWFAKTQVKHFESIANKEPHWLGRNIHELVPMLIGETAYDQCRQVATWTKEMCAAPEPCYATRRVTAKR
jgi:hypothetical protein